MADTYIYLIRNESNSCIFIRNLETAGTNQHDVYLGPGAEARYYDDNRPRIPTARNASEFERHRMVIQRPSVHYSVYEYDGQVRVTTGGWVKDGNQLPGYSGQGSLVLVIDRAGSLKGEFHSHVGIYPLAAVNWAPSSMAVFGVDVRNQVLEKSWSVKGWGPWSSIGAPDSVTLKGPVTAASWISTMYSVAAVGANGKVYESRWETLKRSDWMDLGSPAVTPLVSLAGVSGAPTNYDLFAVGSNGRLYQKWWNISGWRDWADFGRPEKTALLGPITAVCWRSGTYGVYILGADGNVYQKYWKGQWSPWESIGRPAAGVVNLASVSWDYTGLGRYAIYAVCTDGAMYEKAWNGFRWSNWKRFTPPNCGFAGPVAAVCWMPEAYVVYASGRDGRLYEMAWPTRWGRWEEIPGN